MQEKNIRLEEMSPNEIEAFADALLSSNKVNRLVV